ncbi:hypothetical protein BOTBODRAFT_176454 [Botryobasidium botryosum FD-172 SS1]|uniref:Reverse transcriptase domain-containing protein n=1 Tax=Botryobasidium botryosum (strain FD-172 SS1) TaxID=930990 RepID=A0A067MAC8_BOTB1|nr:hypothetical protein BOTBODRAFT_176454 [Botryobasidium botryosum FD-172 SS1]
MPGVPRKQALEEEDKESTPPSPLPDTTTPPFSPSALPTSPKDTEMQGDEHSESSGSELDTHSDAASDSEHEWSPQTPTPVSLPAPTKDAAEQATPFPPELIPHLLAALNAWANSFGISIDPGKTEVMWLFPDGRSPPPPLPGLNVVEVMRWLGVDYDQKLTFNAHVANILKKANNNMAPLFVIKRLSGGVSAAAALRFYLGAIRPILTYSAPTWWTDKAAHGDKLNSYQYRLLNRCLGHGHD